MMNLYNSLEKKVKDLAIWSILLMSYTNHYSHTPSLQYHCKCKLTELRREKIVTNSNHHHTEKIKKNAFLDQ